MGIFRKMKQKKEAESQRKIQQEKDFERLKKAIEEQRIAKLQQEYESISFEKAVSIMGGLEHYTGYYIGSIESTIFDKKENIELCVYEDDEIETGLTKEHIKTYKYIIENRKKIENEIVNELEKCYEIEDIEKTKNKFRPTSIIIFSNGNSGMEFDDLDEPEGISSKKIVVEITPNISYFGSVDDYS